MVDDDQGQRTIASDILNILNYRCHRVSSGEEIIAYLCDNQADLIILDMLM